MDNIALDRLGIAPVTVAGEDCLLFTSDTRHRPSSLISLVSHHDSTPRNPQAGKCLLNHLALGKFPGETVGTSPPAAACRINDGLTFFLKEDPAQAALVGPQISHQRCSQQSSWPAAHYRASCPFAGRPQHTCWRPGLQALVRAPGLGTTGRGVARRSGMKGSRCAPDLWFSFLPHSSFLEQERQNGDRAQGGAMSRLVRVALQVSKGSVVWGRLL